MQGAAQPVNVNSASTRLDQLDAEHFRDMMASHSFRLFIGRLGAELERFRLLCETASDYEQVRRAQGGVAAFRIALAIPDIILKEIESKRRT